MPCRITAFLTSAHEVPVPIPLQLWQPKMSLVIVKCPLEEKFVSSCVWYIEKRMLIIDPYMYFFFGFSVLNASAYSFKV
jgi:hypothetical protein